MAQNYYDEFVKLPLDKMAQKMEDMTFLYHETRVPKKHYKEKLSVAVEEMIESGVEMNLIATYYRTLEELKKTKWKMVFPSLTMLGSRCQTKHYQTFRISSLRTDLCKIRTD